VLKTVCLSYQVPILLFFNIGLCITHVVNVFGENNGDFLFVWKKTRKEV
jgi:hypothetical protein